MIFLISYDLNVPGKNYNELYKTIKSAGTWWHYLESTWLIKTEESIATWNKRLIKNLDENDRLFIVDITGQDNDGWLEKKAWEWIRKHNS